MRHLLPPSSAPLLRWLSPAPPADREPTARRSAVTITLTEALRTSPWEGRPVPATPAGWTARAEEVAAILALDAVERDRAGAVPDAEVRLLKDSRLTLILGPEVHGGGGQPWTTALQAVR